MATLIIIVVIGLFFAFFATQNTGNVSINFLNYSLSEIPIYAVVIVSSLLGLFLSWILSMLKGIGTGFTLRGKEGKIKAGTKENEELTRRVHQLEIENAKLTTAANLPSS